MSKLTVDQKRVKGLFQDTQCPFLIPDYQRPYAWGEDECKKLWDDLFDFAFPEKSSDGFKSTDEYFLGPIVTFKNDEGKMEIIDGQQRLTTLMLLLRAFYNRLGKMQDINSRKLVQNIEGCLWARDMYDNPVWENLKIDSQVASDDDKEEFMAILKDGDAGDKKSRYAQNFQLFEKLINGFLSDFPTYFAKFPAIILNNCVLLPIEAESQDTALRIFSTLNDRGMPLSDADIFKAQLYKHYKSQGRKDEFTGRWKALEQISSSVFRPVYGTPMDELFTRYMYYLRALAKTTNTTTESLRRFYEKDSYAILKKESTLADLEALADFWRDISKQNSERFSLRVLRRLLVLEYAPNGMWTYLVSVYFMNYKDEKGRLPEERFFNFLTLVTAFILAYALTNPGVNSLRTPVFKEMVNLIERRAATFRGYLPDEATFRSIFSSYTFKNGRALTKSFLTWRAFQRDDQVLLPLTEQLDIEHIFPRERYAKEPKALSDAACLELLGNKSLLEHRINIRASDYRFQDKKKYYNGYANAKGERKEGTRVAELRNLAKIFPDWSEPLILSRNQDILDEFVDELRRLKLLK